MELTAEQRRIVEHVGAPVRVTGGYGYGRTTAMVARYLGLVGRHRASTVLMVCPSRAAAGRFRDAVLPHLSGGFDALPITTWFGVAFDLIRRGGREVRLLNAAEQRATVRRLLAAESPGHWPMSAPFLHRAAFADEVATALLAVQGGDAGSSALPGRWAELARFAERYLAYLDERGQVDRAGLFAAAAGSAVPGAYAHVLVDDYDGSDPSLRRLLGAVAGPADDVTVVARDPAGSLPWPVVQLPLTRPFRRAAEPVLVTCRHPSTEPEAVAAELWAARGEGVAWSDMAILLRRPQLHGRRVARALSRHGIPVAAGVDVAARAHDPMVAALVDLLRWVADPEGAVVVPARLLASPLGGVDTHGLRSLRDELAAMAATATPAELAFLVWERALGPILTRAGRDDPALDAIVAFLDRLERDADNDPRARLPDLIAAVDAGGMEPDRWRVSVASEGDADAVVITSITAAAGREWHTVLLTGCVEGELPRISGRAPLFDPALLDGTVAPSPAERRERSLAEERDVFALACSRAAGRLIGTAAPQPGVLPSRFVERWRVGPARPLDPLGHAPEWLAPTKGAAEVFPDGRLVLSATQLDTYDDCPLRYAYKYAVRTTDQAGALAALGTLVHAVLAEFLDPGRTDPPSRTREELLRLAADRWTDDIALYRPQVEECRRDYFQMLEDWWAVEGYGPGAPEVLCVERRFDVEVGDLRLVGAIDRVDRAADGEGIRIVDYKTGRREPRPDAMPQDLQLAIYHLAATRDAELAGFGPPRELRLLYLRSMRAYEQPVADDHAATTEARIADAAQDIRAERFEPSVDASCRTCSFHRLCPLQPEGRQVGA